jgi:hypothetical protein
VSNERTVLFADLCVTRMQDAAVIEAVGALLKQVQQPAATVRVENS